MTCSNYCLRHIIDTLPILSTNEHVSYTDEEFVLSEDIIITKYPEYSPFGRGSKVTLLCGKSKVEFAKKKLFTNLLLKTYKPSKTETYAQPPRPPHSRTQVYFLKIFLLY